MAFYPENTNTAAVTSETVCPVPRASEQPSGNGSQSHPLLNRDGVPVLFKVPAESPEAEEEQQRLLSNSYKQLAQEQEKRCQGLEQYNFRLEAQLIVERNAIVSQQQQMRELQDQVDYMQRQIAQGGKWTSMLLHDRDLLLSCYQGACRDADSAHRESASLWQQVQELQQENEALKEAAAAASTRAKRSSTSAGLAHGQVKRLKASVSSLERQLKPLQAERDALKAQATATEELQAALHKAQAEAAVARQAMEAMKVQRDTAKAEAAGANTKVQALMKEQEAARNQQKKTSEGAGRPKKKAEKGNGKKARRKASRERRSGSATPTTLSDASACSDTCSIPDSVSKHSDGSFYQSPILECQPESAAPQRCRQPDLDDPQGLVRGVRSMASAC